MEYPKALYKNGECQIVEDEKAEKASRKQGYDDWTADHERAEAPAPAADQKPEA